MICNGDDAIWIDNCFFITRVAVKSQYLLGAKDTIKTLIHLVDYYGELFSFNHSFMFAIIEGTMYRSRILNLSIG